MLTIFASYDSNLHFSGHVQFRLGQVFIGGSFSPFLREIEDTRPSSKHRIRRKSSVLKLKKRKGHELLGCCCPAGSSASN